MGWITSSIGAVVLVISAASCQLVAPSGLRAAQAPADACMDALISGRLTQHPQSGLGITSSDGQATPVEWPFGYTARNDVGRLALVDETGQVVAHEGDEIMVGGGFGANMWHACGPVSIVVSD